MTETEQLDVFLYIDAQVEWAEDESTEKWMAACHDATEAYNDMQNGRTFPFLSCYFDFDSIMMDYLKYKGCHTRCQNN